MLWRWLYESREEDCVSSVTPVTSSLGRGNYVRSIDQHGLNFTVYSAQGGTIIELRAYDERTDRQTNKLFVVHDDKDLGKELDHIITLEALKR